jgi:hypothetical protein
MNIQKDTVIKMKKINNFLYTYGNLVITMMLLLLLLKSCGNDSKRIIDLSNKVDSLATKKDLQIEGLKTEMRMIQSTDRKMLDVTRQAEIPKEIEKLSK